MKRIFLFLLVGSLACSIQGNAQLVDKLKTKVKQRVDDHVDKAMDKTLDAAENSVNGNGEPKSESRQQDKTAANSTGASKGAAPGDPSFKVYQNYDFVPGERILFEDHFSGEQDGEFPAHWVLDKGQATLNKLDGEEAFFLTEGNYVAVRPRMKTEKFLKEPFTVEFDYYNKDDAYGIVTFFGHIDPACNCEGSSDVHINATEVKLDGDPGFSKAYPSELENNFINRWHHVAIAVKGHQMKVYVDQDRVLVVPDTKYDFYNVSFGGIGDEAKPIIFKNVRVAAGGGMNMIGKKFTDAKIITHGINFDVDKATLRPESMGTLNMIVQVLKENPELRFEIDGHTDNSGAAAHNLALSQSRAEAVRAQLISMGIDASRLTTKGFGDTKPMADNATPEGKANNRRVEFVRL